MPDPVHCLVVTSNRSIFPVREVLSLSSFYGLEAQGLTGLSKLTKLKQDPNWPADSGALAHNDSAVRSLVFEIDAFSSSLLKGTGLIGNQKTWV